MTSHAVVPRRELGRARVLRGVVAALLLVASPASAATFTVDSSGDQVDASPGNGTCESPCSLRGAIQTANAAAGADVINVPALHVDMADGAADGADPAATGDLDITQDLTITGAGRTATVV